MDPFDTFGIAPAFDVPLGALEQRYRELSRVVHPDRHALSGAGERRRALEKAVDVNAAWRALRDPVSRAEALLRRLGVETGERKEPAASPALLMEVMEQREALAEASAKRDAPAIAKLVAWGERREHDVVAALAQGFINALAEGAAGEALVRSLGELRYARRFLDEARAIEEDIATSASLSKRHGGSGQDDLRIARHESNSTMTLFDIFDPKAPPQPIGIDLGTTNSLVAYVRDGHAEVISDCNGERLVPSVVHYGSRGDVVVGSPAARLALDHPRETIVSVKRFMGRGARDPETRRLGPYSFVEPKSETDEGTVRFLVRERALTPVEVSAEILRELKARAEDELHAVGGAVITVPAYFDDAQRQATKDAARLAGLDVLRLLNEPTAAALAYGLDKKQNGTFAVYDLGGGTFDVTILLLDDGVFQVRSTGGDSALGGDDVDRSIAERMILPFMGAEEAAQREPEVVRFAIDAARRAKHALTDAPVVALALPVRGGGERELTISRDELATLVAPLLERTGVACRRALRDAGMVAASLDGVILVGGSTRMPAVRTYVEQLFGRAPLSDIDPDEVVARGAALQADLIAGEGGDEVLLLDVLPLSLGIETMGGVVDKILPRNMTIPASARSTFTTYAENQTGFEVHVVQGEREFAADCRSLARFTLRGIPPMAAGAARLEVTFSVDADGLLHVAAREATTGIEQRIDVKPSYGLDDDEVEQMLIDALEHGEGDLDARRLAEARVEAERLLLATRKALATNDSALLEQGERERIELAAGELERAISMTSAALVQARVDALDRATHAWAGRRMDAAVARAIAGKPVGEIAETVAHAKGIEAAHEGVGRGALWPLYDS